MTDIYCLRVQCLIYYWISITKTLFAPNDRMARRTTVAQNKTFNNHHHKKIHASIYGAMVTLRATRCPTLLRTGVLSSFLVSGAAATRS